jgi:probable rRNA maturation factor
LSIASSVTTTLVSPIRGSQGEEYRAVVNVFLGDEQDEPLDSASLLRFAEMILVDEGFPDDTHMAVMLVTREQMAEYNRRFMSRRGPTDVLAFPIEDLSPGLVPTPAANEPPVELGDVFLCPSEIKRHAANERVDFDGYLHLLLAHGILHLLGYDHEEEEGARLMERREEELLGLVGRKLW